MERFGFKTLGYSFNKQNQCLFDYGIIHSLPLRKDISVEILDKTFYFFEFLPVKVFPPALLNNSV